MISQLQVIASIDPLESYIESSREGSIRDVFVELRGGINSDSFWAPRCRELAFVNTELIPDGFRDASGARISTDRRMKLIRILAVLGDRDIVKSHIERLIEQSRLEYLWDDAGTNVILPLMERLEQNGAFTDECIRKELMKESFLSLVGRVLRR